MNRRFSFLLAAILIAPAVSSAAADPLPGSIRPDTVGAVAPTDPNVRRAITAPAPTGPCRADLRVGRIDISRGADGRSYNVTATIENVGTEAATGPNGILGVSLEVRSNVSLRETHYSAPIGNIDVIHPGTSRSYSGSVSNGVIRPSSRYLSARINRGPDGPRCVYDSVPSNDALAVTISTADSWLRAGHSVYTRSVN
ncbi:MAG: hypothetical protein ABL914_11205 [Novosphingobium sp.]|uniref:hypothetical protein n=1 Tax=Novosphingobium sp. TaxID=1874826 RepID=UPI0032BB1932